MKKIIVLGGGPSGLSAAWQIGRLNLGKMAVFEKLNRIGGICGYYDFDGLRLDLGPHKIYSVIPGLMDAFKELAGQRIVEMTKKHKIVIRGRLLDYPVKLAQVLPLFTPQEVAVLGFSILATVLKTPFLKEPASYQDYCLNVFGRKIYEVVFAPLAEKIWGDPRSLSADIARTRIPTKNIYDLVFRVLGLKKESKHTDAQIMLYPPLGFYDICECLAEKIKEQGNEICLGKAPRKITIDDGRIRSVTFDDGSRQETDLVISTIPLKDLTELLFPDEKDILTKDDFVQMRGCIIAYFLVDKPQALNDHWLFCADRETLFSRVAEQKLFSPEQFPRDKTVISCDFTCDQDGALWERQDDSIAKECIQGLEKLKILKNAEVIKYHIVRIPHFYPVYGLDYAQKMTAALERVNRIENIIVSGRLGLCNHSNIDHCLDMSGSLTKGLSESKVAPEINKELFQKSLLYRIVD